jgi:hypothetical protein
MFDRYYHDAPSPAIYPHRYRSTGRTSTLIFIHAFAGKSGHFNEGLVIIAQVFNAFPCGEFISILLFLYSFFATTEVDLFKFSLHFTERKF